ncbi:MAG TPA: prepilin peptidase [Gaiellaceae bacterium]|jgi:leader peptidase (prepilin peptidase)/N-methyltransferase|nr:prepilin peptidase [Gaiellaceae bacterium]
MTGAVAALAFLPGLAIGSFLNVVAARIPARISIVAPRSCCPGCSSEIAWYDNIPIVSYLLLRGRCRGCKGSISLKYPLVELTTAVLVSACILDFGVTPTALVAAVFCATLVVITVTDLERRIIPNRIVLPAAAFVLVGNTLIDHSPQWAIAAVAASGFLLLAALAYPRGLGMGDVKLALLLGAALGTTVPVALMTGFLAALVPSIVLLARHGSAARKMAIPLGPFLALGGLVALFAGDAIVNAYLGLM